MRLIIRVIHRADERFWSPPRDRRPRHERRIRITHNFITPSPNTRPHPILHNNTSGVVEQWAELPHASMPSYLHASTQRLTPMHPAFVCARTCRYPMHIRAARARKCEQHHCNYFSRVPTLTQANNVFIFGATRETNRRQSGSLETQTCV